MRVKLGMQAIGGTFDTALPDNEEEAADDEEEEPGHPSSGYRETHSNRENKGRRQTGPDGERLPNAAIRGLGNLAKTPQY